MYGIKKGITQELEVQVGKVEEEVELRMEDRLGEFKTDLVAQFREMETKTAKGFESKREEILGKIEEGQIQAVRMGEKL